MSVMLPLKMFFLSNLYSKSKTWESRYVPVKCDFMFRYFLTKNCLILSFEVFLTENKYIENFKNFSASKNASDSQKIHNGCIFLSNFLPIIIFSFSLDLANILFLFVQTHHSSSNQYRRRKRDHDSPSEITSSSTASSPTNSSRRRRVIFIHTFSFNKIFSHFSS